MATPLGTKDLVFTTVPENPSKMGSNTEIDKNNIIEASVEDLSEEEQRNIATLQKYVKMQYLMGVKKDRKDKAMRVQDFEMPAIKMKDSMIEEVCNVSDSPSDQSAFNEEFRKNL